MNKSISLIEAAWNEEKVELVTHCDVDELNQFASNSNTSLETKSANPLTNPLYNTSISSSNNEENKGNIMEVSQIRLLQQIHNELMISNEKYLLYFSILLTIICGILRLIFFSFIGAIIDLLGNTYDYDERTGDDIICSFHEYIDCSTDKSLITVFIITLIILSILLSLSKLSQSLLTTFCCNSFIKRLNHLVFDIIIYSDLSFFDCTEIRDLRYLLTSDMKHIAKTFYSTENIIESFIYFICCLIYLFMFNWQIALIVIVSFVLLIIVSIIYHKHAVKIYKNRSNSFKIAVITLTEMLNYIITIKIFSKEDDESFLYQQCINRAFKYDKKKKVTSYCYRLWVTLITYFTILFVIWYGTVANHISIGQIIINLFILLQLNYSIYSIIKLSNKLYPESVDRVINVVNIDEINKEEKEEKEEKEFPAIGGDDKFKGLIEMRNIEFSYPWSSKLTLNDISLSFYPSSTTALVGVSGSGKSSILKLIMKFYSPQRGEILIDNMDIDDYNLSFLHAQIGYIGQNIHLFANRTIADNIKFGIKLDQKHWNLFDSKYFTEEYLYFWRQCKSIKQSAVEEAAKIANAHEFIMNLDKGYKTIIGGRNGIKLSEGEKQRIGIARTILLKPKILLLDEAMSHLDEISKNLIQQSLDKIINGRCVIVIAHRLKTVMRADMIYVIDKGRIVQSGNHEQLMQITDGQYFRLNRRETFN